MRRFRCVLSVISLAILGSSQACHILQLTEEGFGGSFLHALHALAIYENSGGGAFLIDQNKFPYRCDDSITGGLSDLFNHTITPWSPELQAIVEKEEGQPCKRLDYLAVDHQIALIGASWDDLDSLAIKRIWRLQPEVQKEASGVLRELRKLAQPTIAFHVRGGDLTSAADEQLFSDDAPDIKAKDMVDTFLKTYPGLRGGTCIFVGDDHKLIDETAAIASKALTCRIFKRKKFHNKSGFVQADFNQEPLEQRCQSSKHLIADMELMAHADYFVGSLESNVPHVVQMMRFALYLKDRRTFVDASAKHRDWYEAIRNYFREQQASGAPAAPAHPASGKLKPKRSQSGHQKGRQGGP